MSAEEHYRKLERMYLGAPVNRIFDPRIEIGEGKATVTIPIRSEFFHAAHAAHGMIYFKLLDDAAFFAVNSLVEDVFVLTVSIQSASDPSDHRGRRAGYGTGRASIAAPVYRRRSGGGQGGPGGRQGHRDVHAQHHSADG